MAPVLEAAVWAKKSGFLLLNLGQNRPSGSQDQCSLWGMNHIATLMEELNAHQKNRANINEFLFYDIFTI